MSGSGLSQGNLEVMISWLLFDAGKLKPTTTKKKKQDREREHTHTHALWIRLDLCQLNVSRLKAEINPEKRLNSKI